MATIANTRIDHLGPGADELDLEIYQLATTIRRDQLDHDHPNDPSNEDQACVDIWNDGSWTERAIAVIGQRYAKLSPRDQGLYDGWKVLAP